MKVIVGCDHAGFEYKKSLCKYLRDNGINFSDFGTNNCDSVDYPDYAHAVAKEVQKNSINKGVLICGSANGVAMAANKHKGIRAAICWNNKIAELATTHNRANVLCIHFLLPRSTNFSDKQLQHYKIEAIALYEACLLYTSPSPRDS